MKIVDRRTGTELDADAPEHPDVRAAREYRRVKQEADELDRKTSAVRAALGVTGPGSGRHAKDGRRGGRHRAD